MSAIARGALPLAGVKRSLAHVDRLTWVYRLPADGAGSGGGFLMLETDGDARRLLSSAWWHDTESRPRDRAGLPPFVDRRRLLDRCADELGRVQRCVR